MDVLDIPVLGALRTRMAYLSERQDVLAENIANANTPGYAAKDLAALSFQDLLNGTARLAATDPRHFTGGPDGGRAFETRERPDAITALNGNSVSLETQMIKVAETQIAYATATGLYQKAVGLIRVALGRGQA